MTSRITHSLVVLFLISSCPISAQEKGIKVLLLYDMEGMSGATRYEYTTARFPDDYTEGRKMMTDDVNAAIRGLVAGGATDVVVVDGHGSGNREEPDVIEEALLPPARMHFRDTWFDIYMDSYDSSIDAIVAVGMHASASNKVGFLAHTYNSHDVDYRVNGIPFNESMILAAGAARLKIPLIMVSGDDQLGKEITRHMPWVRYATVKRAVSLGKAEALPAGESARRIERAARDALRDLDNARLPEWPGPYRFAITYQDKEQAEAGVRVRDAEIIHNGLGVEIRSDDFEEGYRRSTQSLWLSGDIAWSTALMSVIEEQSNADALIQAAVARIYDRWIDPSNSVTGKAATEDSQQRYWGAR